MRGEDRDSGFLFSYVSCEARVPADHPLRPIRAIVDEALEVLSPEFEGLYPKIGRPSIPPEKLMRALLLQAFYTIRSERQLMEQLDYNLLFRWFVGLSMDAPVWDPSVYSKNRDRLIEGEVAVRFLSAVLQGVQVKKLLSDDHFSVDGTLIDAWASMNSFRPKGNSDDAEPPPGRNAERNFRGEKRSNETHASVTDPDVRLYRKGDGQSSRLCFMGHLLMENRDALIIDATLTHATGTAERDAALVMLDRRKRRRRITLGADKAYDVSGFVDELRARKTTPHIAIDGHLTKAAQDKDRPPHHPPFGLYREPAHAKAHRGELRLDQDHRRPRQDPPSRPRSGRLDVHVGCGRLQLGTIAEAVDGSRAMTAPMNCRLIGRWRIVEADLWDRGFLDLVEPATLIIQDDGHGEIAFGAMQASLDLEYSRSMVFFTWAGFDEMDEVSGSGSAELLDDGSLKIEFAYHLGDEAVLKAKRATSSAAC